MLHIDHTSWLQSFHDYHFTFKLIRVIITKAWAMPIERAITKHPSIKRCATIHSLRDGIVLLELQEQKCQQRVCQHTDVEQTGRAGWWLLILHWKMVKFSGRSALVIALLVANTQTRFLLKTVDPTSSTSFFNHLVVIRATVLQTECNAKTSTK